MTFAFFSPSRGGSVRAAAQRVGVNHATVLRRVAQLEERLGAHTFEKLPSGYRLTAAGEEVLELAEQMEASSHQLETRVFGRDQSVRGLLRVTLAPPLAKHLLMPDFAEFARLHPDIEMDILASGELVNLTNREADVAIRVVYDRKTLPLSLHGLKAPKCSEALASNTRKPSLSSFITQGAGKRRRLSTKPCSALECPS
jgi:DNA-binding transcriptional LysR family regulator